MAGDEVRRDVEREGAHVLLSHANSFKLSSRAFHSPCCIFSIAELSAKTHSSLSICARTHQPPLQIGRAHV